MRIRTLSAVVVFALAPLATASAQEAVQYINGRSASQTTAPPFSGAVLVGNTLYLSGVLGAGATGEEAARAALDNMRNTLTAAGMTMDDLVNVQVFAADLADYQAFNTVYRSYFTREFPARAFLGAGSLLNNAKFEVVGIAARR
ncbi:MAG: RidA family protein [Gemmatimonadales bacterium]